MKADEAPEKIWVRQDTFRIPWTSCIDENANYGGIEYTRTDAFIEKVARYLNRRLYDRVEVVNFGSTFESIIIKEEFVDEFRKYMKGE